MLPFLFYLEPEAGASPARKSPGQMSSDTVQSNETADSAQVYTTPLLPILITESCHFFLCNLVCILQVILGWGSKNFIDKSIFPNCGF